MTDAEIDDLITVLSAGICGGFCRGVGCICAAAAQALAELRRERDAARRERDD